MTKTVLVTDLFLESGNHIVEGSALLDEMVDLLSDGAVVAQRGVEVDHDAVETILQEGDALTDIALLPVGCRFATAAATATATASAGRGRGGRSLGPVGRGTALVGDLPLNALDLDVEVAGHELLLLDGSYEVLLRENQRLRDNEGDIAALKAGTTLYVKIRQEDLQNSFHKKNELKL